MTKLAIRVDASSDIGIGHLFRCLWLAEYLRKKFETITFIAYNPSNFYCDKIRASGFNLKKIPEQDDLEFLDEKYDFVIKDHYNLNMSWEKKVKDKTLTFIVIDDRHDKKHICDIYINQNPVKVHPKYLPFDCLILNGLQYAMLPDRLSKYKNKTKGSNILVSFGGSDPTKEMLKCLDAFLYMNDYHFHFIAGKENPLATEIESICYDTPHFTYYHFLYDIFELAAIAVACVTSGGTFLRELIYIQAPIFLITNNELQIPIAEYFECQNTVFYAGHHNNITANNLKKSFANFISNKDQLEIYKHNMISLIDGKGLLRITNTIMCPDVTLMAAKWEHCHMIYNWRNHPKTRKYAGNSGEISLESHTKWFSKKLEDTKSYFFISQANNKDIGVLRFDQVGKELLVSIYLSPEYYGHGYGAFILQAGIRYLKENSLTPVSLLAKISTDNIASKNLFEKLGFLKIDGQYWKKDIA